MNARADRSPIGRKQKHLARVERCLDNISLRRPTRAASNRDEHSHDLWKELNHLSFHRKVDRVADYMVQ